MLFCGSTIKLAVTAVGTFSAACLKFGLVAFCDANGLPHKLGEGGDVCGNSFVANTFPNEVSVAASAAAFAVFVKVKSILSGGRDVS